MNTIIQTGIKSEHREATARLYVNAFEGKFSKILGEKEEVINLFKGGVNTNRAISAISETNELYGIFRGIFKLGVIAILFDRKPDNSAQLLMDGIAVKEGNRGKGIGKHLFQALEIYAQENELHSIKLDVIDENPGAKKLYEKLGFVPTNYQKVPKVIGNLIGVSGVTTMVKKIS